MSYVKKTWVSGEKITAAGLNNMETGIETADAQLIGVVAPDYSASATYDYGAYVMHDGGLYMANRVISTPEAWTASHWTAVTAGAEILGSVRPIGNYVTIYGITGAPAGSLSLGSLPINRILYISNAVHPSESQSAFTDEPFFKFFGTILTMNQSMSSTSGALQVAMRGASSGLDDIFYRRGVSNGWHQWIQILTSLTLGADQYDVTATYAKGDYCIYNNSLYICKTAIATPENWTSGHWTKTSILGELKALETRIAALE